MRSLLVGLTCAFLMGCAGDAGPFDGIDTTLADTVSADDASDATSGDTVAEDTVSADTSRPAAFEIGTNLSGEAQPSAFIPLDDGDSLEIVYGPQGLWMVVMAFRTRGMLANEIDLDVSIRVGETEQGRVHFIDQTLLAGPEGFFYYYNLFLIVEDPTVTGSAGTISYTLTDDSGGRVEGAIEVALTGGQ